MSLFVECVQYLTDCRGPFRGSAMLEKVLKIVFCVYKIKSLILCIFKGCECFEKLDRTGGISGEPSMLLINHRMLKSL